MVTHPGLEGLLAALREAGLRVGVGELERVQRIFELVPDFAQGSARSRLRALLRPVVVKSLEERAAFDEVYDAWLEQTELALSEPVPAPAVPRWVPPRRASLWRRLWRQRWRRVAVRAAALLLPLTTLVFLFVRHRAPAPVPSPPPPLELPPDSAPPSSEGPIEPSPAEVDMYWLENPDPAWEGWPPLGLGFMALVAAGGLWGALRRRRALPEVMDAPAKSGPPRELLTVHEPQKWPLLDAEQLEALVWGIGHYVAEEPTRRLDLPATVRATARAAGQPRLFFHRARYHREVWLWVDEAAEDPTLARLADEIAAALTAHGLPVERATFRGLPDRLVTEKGRLFAPREVDERRDGALVAVLTDGRALLRCCSVERYRQRAEALLRQLSHWSRLAFVDFSPPEEHGLRRLVERFELEVLLPEDLAVALAASSMSLPSVASRPMSSARVAAPRTSDLVWSAACALSPAPVEDPTALELRQRLGFSSSAWELRALRARGRGSLGRLRWTRAERARLLNWLRQAEDGMQEGRSSGGFEAALDFWLERYEAELLDQEEGTPAHRQLLLERSLLELWRRPEEASRRLYELGGASSAPVRRHLAGLTPRDRGEADQARLPWSWGEVSASARVMLREMGLGGEVPSEKLRRPGRLGLGVGLSLGLAAAALGMGAWKPAVECAPVERTDPRNGMVLVRMCPGTFEMGSPEEEEGRDRDESPVHEVALSEFWIAKYEVTHAQFKAWKRDHESSWDRRGLEDTSRLPVTDVSWTEAREFCEQRGYQLPTEAQWEYAARAGTKGRWSFGDEESELGEFAWFEGNSGGEPQPVGTKNSNPWGLHDMHGNVWEWCWDWLGPYEANPQADPTGPPNGTSRVLRGGSFANGPRFLRSAFRGWGGPVYRDGFFGFRCVRVSGRQL